MITKIIEIVREASEIMKSHDFKVMQKGNASNLVTEADIKVHLSASSPE